MTPAALAAQLHFTIEQLVIEANHQRNPLTDQRLRSSARQLRYHYTGAYSPDPQVRAAVERVLEEALDELVSVIINGEPGLAIGETLIWPSN